MSFNYKIFSSYFIFTFIAVVSHQCVLSMEVRQNPKEKYLARAENHKRLFGKAPSLFKQAYGFIFAESAPDSILQSSWNEALNQFYCRGVCFNKIHVAIALRMNQAVKEEGKEGKKFIALKVKYNELAENYLQKFDDKIAAIKKDKNGLNEEEKKECEELLYAQKYFGLRIVAAEEYVPKVDSSGLTQYFSLDVTRKEFSESVGVLYKRYEEQFIKDRGKIVELYKEGKISELKLFVESLDSNYVKIAITSLIFGPYNFVTETSALLAEVASDTIEAFELHHPKALKKLDLSNVITHCLNYSYTLESQQISENIVKKIFIAVPFIDGLRQDGSSCFHALISARIFPRDFGENIRSEVVRLFTPAKSKLMKTLLEEMKKVYRPQQLTALLNYPDRDNRSALVCALKIHCINVMSSGGSEIQLDVEDVVNQLLEAGAYDYEAISIFKTLPLDQESYYWVQKAFNKLKMNFIKAGKQEEIDLLL